MRRDHRSGKVLAAFLVLLVLAGWCPGQLCARGKAMGPDELLREGEAALKLGEPRKAIRSAKRLLKRHPDAQEAASAQFLLGAAYEATDEPRHAVRAYGEILSGHPGSDRVKEAITRLVGIGRFFQKEAQPKGMARVFKPSPLEHAMEAFRLVVKNFPYDRRSAELQYLIGQCAFDIGDYDLAVLEWDVVVGRYSLSEYLEKAHFGAAEATFRQILPVGYDTGSLREAGRRLEEFVERFPKSPLAPEAEKLLGSVLEVIAEDLFSVGMFYEKGGSYKAAWMVYQAVIKEHPGSKWATRAQERSREVAGLELGKKGRKR